MKYLNFLFLVFVILSCVKSKKSVEVKRIDTSVTQVRSADLLNSDADNKIGSTPVTDIPSASTQQEIKASMNASECESFLKDLSSNFAIRFSFNDIKVQSSIEKVVKKNCSVKLDTLVPAGYHFKQVAAPSSIAYIKTEFNYAGTGAAYLQIDSKILSTNGLILHYSGVENTSGTQNTAADLMYASGEKQFPAACPKISITVPFDIIFTVILNQSKPNVASYGLVNQSEFELPYRLEKCI